MAFEDRLAAVREQVQVNVPFWFLRDRYLELFLTQRLNPEIGLDSTCLSRFRRQDFQEVAERFHAAGLQVTLHAPFQDLLPGALDDLILQASRARLQQAFDLLPVFRPRSVVCHLGFESRHYSGARKQWLANSLATWQPLAEQAAAVGAKLALENVYETEPELLVELVQRLQAPNVCLCLDVGHLQAFGGGDFDTWLPLLGPFVGHLHLHDNHGQADEHLALGRGLVPLERVLEYFASRSPAPIITLEPHQENSLWPSLEFLARHWPWSPKK